MAVRRAGSITVVVCDGFLCSRVRGTQGCMPSRQTRGRGNSRVELERFITSVKPTGNHNIQYVNLIVRASLRVHKPWYVATVFSFTLESKKKKKKKEQNTCSLHVFVEIRCVCLCACSSTQWCLTLCNSMGFSLPGFLSIEFPRQEYWHGLSFPLSGDLPAPGTEPESLASPAPTVRSFTTSATWKGP